MYTQTAFSKWGGGPTGQLSISAVLMVLYLLALITSYFSVFIYFIFFKGSIAMHCILLPSNILRVIWMFTLQWGGRFGPHSWDRPDWAHWSWFDCSILILFSTNTACVLVTNLMYECLSHPYLSVVHCCRFNPFQINIQIQSIYASTFKNMKGEKTYRYKKWPHQKLRIAFQLVSD